MFTRVLFGIVLFLLLNSSVVAEKNCPEGWFKFLVSTGLVSKVDKKEVFVKPKWYLTKYHDKVTFAETVRNCIPDIKTLNDGLSGKVVATLSKEVVIKE